MTCNKLTIILLYLTFIFTGCGSKDRQSDKILVSIPPQAYIVRQLLGENANVQTILNSNANPELFEPGMKTMMSLMNSSVYFSVGTLDFEKKLIYDAESKKAEINIVDTSKDIKLLYGTHDNCEHNHGNETAEQHSHSGSAPDPHIWSTPENMKVMANTMATELIRIYPDKETNIKERLASFLSKMDKFDADLRHAFDISGTKTFMVWHPSLSYLADKYGLTQIPVGIHSKEPSAKQLAEQIARARGGEIKLLFIQKEFDPEQSKVISDDSDIKVVTINPMSEDWDNEMRIIINAFKNSDGQAY